MPSTTLPPTSTEAPAVVTVDGSFLFVVFLIGLFLLVTAMSLLNTSRRR